MAFPDDPIGGIWRVRPVGQDGRTTGRERKEGESGERRIKRKPGHDRVTLSVEAKKLSLEGNEQENDASEDESGQH